MEPMDRNPDTAGPTGPGWKCKRDAGLTELATPLNPSKPTAGSRKTNKESRMKINDEGFKYSQISAVFLKTEHAEGNRMLIKVRPGSFKVDGGMVTFTATVLESDIESLYVPLGDRLANR